MNLQREKGEEQADQPDQNNSLSLKGGKKGKFSKSKKENRKTTRSRIWRRKRERTREWRDDNEGDSSLSPRRVTSIFWEKATPGSFPIHRQDPLWGVAIEESAKVSLPLSLGKMMPRLPQQLTDEIKTKSALEPSFPHPPSSYATNCVLTSPTQVYFTKLLNHRFPEAHYNVFHGCIISTQKEPKSFDGLEILYFFYEI